MRAIIVLLGVGRRLGRVGSMVGALWLAAGPSSAAEAAFPLRVAPSGRHLVDSRGEPFFVNGDTAWSLTHNLSYEEAVRYLEDRRARGINALVVSVPDAYGPDGEAGYPPDRQGNQPFVGGDVTRLDEAYWRHAERVVATAEEMGFAVFLWPFYLGCCGDGYMSLFLSNGPEKARDYGRLVGQRFAGRRNVVWVHGGDHDPGLARGFRKALKDWWYTRGRNPAGARDLVTAVKEGILAAGSRQVHGTHWAPETDPYAPLGEGFTDIYTSYTYGPVAAAVSRHYGHRPVKPVLLIESHYEGDFAGKTGEQVRQYPYRAVLAGAAGDFFGNRPLWFLGRGWEAALDSPGSRSLVHVARLFRSRPWTELVPEPRGRFVVAGEGDVATDDGVPSARARDGTFAMALVPSGRAIEVDLGRVAGPAVRAWWFDVSTGATTPTGEFASGGKQGFAPPGPGGFVLVLDSASRDLPPPGGALARKP